MKKLLSFFALLLLFTSCSSNDDNYNGNNNELNGTTWAEIRVSLGNNGDTIYTDESYIVFYKETFDAWGSETDYINNKPYKTSSYKQFGSFIYNKPKLELFVKNEEGKNIDSLYTVIQNNEFSFYDYGDAKTYTKQ